jgi:hypothetical protein
VAIVGCILALNMHAHRLWLGGVHGNIEQPQRTPFPDKAMSGYPL